jgi:hypothetical protein
LEVLENAQLTTVACRKAGNKARWSLQGAFGNGQKLEISANLLMLVLLLLRLLLLLLLILLLPPPSFGFVFGGHFVYGPLPPALAYHTIKQILFFP